MTICAILHNLTKWDGFIFDLTMNFEVCGVGLYDQNVHTWLSKHLRMPRLPLIEKINFALTSYLFAQQPNFKIENYNICDEHIC